MGGLKELYNTALSPLQQAGGGGGGRISKSFTTLHSLHYNKLGGGGGGGVRDSMSFTTLPHKQIQTKKKAAKLIFTTLPHRELPITTKTATTVKQTLQHFRTQILQHTREQNGRVGEWRGVGGMAQRLLQQTCIKCFTAHPLLYSTSCIECVGEGGWLCELHTFVALSKNSGGGGGGGAGTGNDGENVLSVI